MNEIKLSVDNKNIETVLTILNNLKSGLIAEIQTNNKSTKARPTQYQHKINTVIRDDNFGTDDTSGKYANAATYKQRLKNKR